MLESVWFFLWGVLWAVYFMLDGFDLGAGALMPFLAGDEREKRLVYNAMGPFWDGNEVWLITAGGVTFAAFPTAYAVMFSSLYSALLLLLFALILRGVAFEFRSKVDSDAWRKLWDICLFIGSAAPALLLGVAFANIFMGIPIDAEGVYHGTLFTLLNPYGLMGGVLFVMLFLVHGALWLAIKTPNGLGQKAQKTAKVLWPVMVVVAVAFLAATAFYTRLYENYLAMPVLWLIPLASVAAMLVSRWMMTRKSWWKAWFASSAAILFCALFGVTGMYPNLLASSLDPAYSLNITNAASSPLTLKIMLGVALVMVPVVICYQAWAYHMFRHRLTDEDLAGEEAY